MSPLPNIPWTESPFFESILAAKKPDAALTAEARFFRDHGYLLVDFDLPDFDRVTADVITALAPHYGEDRRIQDAWRQHEGVKTVATHGPILDRLRFLFGREPIPFQTLNFRIGSEQMLHSDAPHFSSIPERFMAGVWVAFEDIDEENGPLTYVPGSHRLPIWKNEELGLISRPDKAVHERTVYRQAWEQTAAALGLENRILPMRKGQALIWAANLLHGGAPIRDLRRSRHSQVTHYYFTDCCYYTPFYSDPFLGRIAFRDIVDIRTGEMVPNRYNGAQLPDHVRQTLDAQTGISGLSAPMAPASGSPEGLRGLARRFLDGAAQWRLGAVRPDGFVVNDRDILLHPNDPGQPPASLTLCGLQQRSTLELTLSLRSERSEPVAFSIEFDVEPGQDGEVARSQWIIKGGTMRRVSLPVPARATGAVTIRTAMAPGATSAAFAWAYLEDPLLA